MLKKIIIVFTMLAFALQSVPMTASASCNSSQQIEYLEDGSCIITTIDETISSGGDFSLCSKTVTKSKIMKYRDTDGTICWDLIVTGTFTYDGKTSKCTSVSSNSHSYDNRWHLTGRTATKEGSTAHTSVVAKRYDGDTLKETLNYTLSLTCSPTGTFS